MPRYILDPKTGERTLVQPASTFAPICQQLNEQQAAAKPAKATPPPADANAAEDAASD